MKIVSAITTFFSHSNYGKKHLKDKLEDEDDTRGLISFGATRFSTFADQSSSVSRCLPAMAKCYSEGLIKFDTKAVSGLSFADRLKIMFFHRQSLSSNISLTTPQHSSLFGFSYTTSTCFSNRLLVVLKLWRAHKWLVPMFLTSGLASRLVLNKFFRTQVCPVLASILLF